MIRNFLLKQTWLWKRSISGKIIVYTHTIFSDCTSTHVIDPGKEKSVQLWLDAFNLKTNQK